MRGWLLDTNVIASLAAPSGAPSVKAWASGQDESRMFLSVLTLAEYDKGIHPWQVPEGLRVLSNREAEDVLCIYKDDFLLTPAQLTAKWEGRRFSGCPPEVEHRRTC